MYVHAYSLNAHQMRDRGFGAGDDVSTIATA